MSSDTHSPTAVPSTGMTVQRWEKIATPWIVLSALIPIVGMAAGKTEGGIVAVIGIACWLVFLVDLIVHMRLSPGYLHTTSGKVDLAIVVLTCPWYLFVGASAGGFVTIARLARLVRVVWVAMRNSKARQLMQRIGQAGIYAGGLLVACSLIVKWVEPESSGYATYGDAFWWGFVTLTTVGYGDLYPVTAVGRIAAICLMLGGVALLGVLAGTLASFFGVGSGRGTEVTKVTEVTDAATVSHDSEATA
ncbi:MAG: ion transporter [Actinobacteria bacterium]|nr:ion transporter [Actinomycetota bacterium]